MGFGGSTAGANASLKNNRALLKRKKYKDLKSLYTLSYSKEKTEYKEVSPEALAIIKQGIRAKAIAERRRTLISTTIIFIIICVGVLFYLSN